MILKLKSFIVNETKRVILFLVISGIALVISFFGIYQLPFDMAWIAIVLCGIPIIKGAIVGLVTKFDIKADVLVSLALISAVIIGEIFAAGEVAFIMQIGALIETLTVVKARAGIEKLVHLSPQIARVINDGKEVIIPAEEVQSGDILRIKPGETIAVDGIIIKGQTSVDQSVMTGESLPVDKAEGDEVKSGTTNQFGSFDMRATKVGADSSLQRMIQLVQSADAGKAKIVGLADRWATWIVVIALIAAGITWLVTGEIIRAVTILVVFCPCALVLATPTAIMAGIGNATKYGILVREGDALERLAQIKRITFDKTGTLTYGKLQVTEVRSFSSQLSDTQLLSMAASVEMRSEHPLGKAIVAYFKDICDDTPKAPKQFQMLPGRGVVAEIGNQKVLAGNLELFADNDVVITNEIQDAASKAMNNGCTIIYFAIDNVSVGYISLADTMRENTNKIVSRIESMGIQTILLTGDHRQSASMIAAQACISDFHAECLPEDKLNIIDEYQKKGSPICMVGDGINDAPALKIAHVGIAMGDIGSDIAIDAADIVFIHDDIRHLPHLIGLSKRMMKIIKINLLLSMSLNFVAIAFATTGILNPVAGALVHNVGSVLVIINSALLLRWKS